MIQLPILPRKSQNNSRQLIITELKPNLHKLIMTQGIKCPRRLDTAKTCLIWRGTARFMLD